MRLKLNGAAFLILIGFSAILTGCGGPRKLPAFEQLACGGWHPLPARYASRDEAQADLDANLPEGKQSTEAFLLNLGACASDVVAWKVGNRLLNFYFYACGVDYGGYRTSFAFGHFDKNRNIDRSRVSKGGGRLNIFAFDYFYDNGDIDRIIVHIVTRGGLIVGSWAYRHTYYEDDSPRLEREELVLAPTFAGYHGPLLGDNVHPDAISRGDLDIWFDRRARHYLLAHGDSSKHHIDLLKRFDIHLVEELDLDFTGKSAHRFRMVPERGAQTHPCDGYDYLTGINPQLYDDWNLWLLYDDGNLSHVIGELSLYDSRPKMRALGWSF